MKRYITLVATACMVAASTMAQNVVEAVRYGNSEIIGTARYRSMAGAFGALGGDPTCMNDNPAGIAIYRGTSLFSLTPHLSFTSAEAFGSKNNTEKDNNSGLSNFAWIGSIKTPLNDYLVNFNFGISMNRRIESFSKYDYTLNGSKGSMGEYLTNQANHYLGNTFVPSTVFDWDNQYTKAPFLSMMGYNCYAFNDDPADYHHVIDPIKTYCDSKNMPYIPHQGLMVTEHTRWDDYNFSAAANFDDRFYIGATLSVADFSSIMESMFDEYYDNIDDILGYDNRFETKGYGMGLNVGVMVSPIDNWRIGAAVHTPTWTTMTEIYDGSMTTDPDYRDENWESYYDEWKYDFTTPWEYQLSTAVIVGSHGLVSLEYDLRDYSSMEYSHNRSYGLTDSYFKDANDAIARSLTLQHTIKAGAEYRINNQFSARAGYAYTTSPYEAKTYSGELSSGYHNITYYSTTKPNFQTLGDQYYITAGGGWRGKCWSIDLSYMYHHTDMKAAAYPGDFSSCQMVNVDVAQQNWDLTLSYRF